MKKFWKLGILGLVIGVVFAGVVAVAVGQGASALTLEEGAAAARCDGCPENLFGDDGVFKQITNVILYGVGVTAVIVLIIGGIKYLISGGDSKKVTDAKNTILYAIIGLIIALLSFAIVNFVIGVMPTGPKNEGSTPTVNSSVNTDSNN